MNRSQNRREAMKAAAASISAGLAVMTAPGFAFPNQGDDEELTPFLNTPRTPPKRLDWETLSDWLTPQDQVFNVQHYDSPTIEPKDYRLEIGGLVERPKTLTLDQIRGLPKRDQLMTLECSGNGAGAGFINAIYNSRWTGSPLAGLLKECGVKPEATEIVFFGYDKKVETLRKGTRRELSVEVPFGRSMSIEDVKEKDPLLAYERNGETMEQRNGAPLRLIVPGWYGIANVKWLSRIELRDRRYMGRYMGRDYVTVRGERNGDKVVFVESSVSAMHLKSMIARVTRRESRDGMVPLKCYGAVWGDGTEIKSVQVKLDDGEWRDAKIDTDHQEKFCWKFFSLELGDVKPGKHTIVSRGVDVNGNIQPSAEDDEIALKKTYWEAYQQWPREIEVDA